MQNGRIVVAPRRSWLPWVAFAGIALVAVRLLVLQVGNDMTFFYDDWEFLLRRRGVSVGTFLRPHSDHLSAVPIAIYKAMLQVFGLHYRPFQWMLMAFLVGLALVVYLYARPRIGVWAALFPVVVILFGGAFWEDTLWAFQIGFIGALLCGVGAFIALDRRTTWGDLLACALLVLSISQASIGLPFVAGVAFELVLRRDWRRLWIVAIPIVLYGGWKLGYPETDVRRDNIPKTPNYVYEAAAGAFGSIFSLDRAPGKILLYATLGLLIDAIIRGRGSIRMWALIVTVLLFWIAAALARAQLGAPDVSRYLLPGATLVMLVGIEAARGLRPNRTVAFVMIALVPILYTHGRDVLRAGSGTMITYSYFLKDEFKALQLIRPHMTIDPKTWQLDPQRAPDIDVASYFSLIDKFGNPAPSWDTVLKTPPEARANADAVMLLGTGTGPGTGLKGSSAPRSPAAAPKIVTRYWADGEVVKGCVRGHAAGGGPNPYLEVAIPPEGIRFRPDGPLVNMGIRLMGNDVQPFGAPKPGGWYSVKPPPAEPAHPWLARFQFAGAPVRICSGG